MFRSLLSIQNLRFSCKHWIKVWFLKCHISLIWQLQWRSFRLIATQSSLKHQTLTDIDTNLQNKFVFRGLTSKEFCQDSSWLHSTLKQSHNGISVYATSCLINVPSLESMNIAWNLIRESFYVFWIGKTCETNGDYIVHWTCTDPCTRGLVD